MTSTRDHLIRKSGLLAVAQLAAKPLGFLAMVSMAARWGQSGQKDDYDLAFTFMSLFMLLIAGLNYYIVPALSRYLAHEPEHAHRLARFSLAVFGLLLAAMAAGLFVFAEPLLTAGMAVFDRGTGADPERVVRLLRWLAPSLFAMGLMTLAGVILNCYGVFYWVVWGQVAYNAGVLAGIYGFANLFPSDHDIAGVAAGNLTGALLAVLLFLPSLARRGVLARGGLRPPAGALREAYGVFWPILVITLFVQVNGFAERFLCVSLPEGAVATYGYAFYLIHLPIQLGEASFQRVFFPSVSREAVLGDRQAGEILLFSVKALLFVFLPLSVFLCVYAREIVVLAWQRGQFTPEDTLRAYPVFQLLACGLAAIALNNLVLSQIFFSLRRPWWRAGIVIIGVAVQIGLGLALRETMGVRGIALATTLSRLLNVVTAFMALAWISRRLPLGPLGSVVVRIAAASAAMGGVSYGVRAAFAGWTGGASAGGALLMLSAGALASLAAYLVLVVVLRLKTMEELRQTALLVLRRKAA